MNILVFTTAYYPSVGGVENQTLNLLAEFLKMGHKVKVVAFPIHKARQQVIKTNEKEVEVFYNPGFLNLFLLFAWCKVLYMPNYSLKGIWFIPFLPFKKLIISHNDLYLSNKKSTKIKIKLLLIKLANENIAVSKFVADYIKTRSKIIYNCYDDAIFKIYEDEERIYDFIFLGRLVSQKGCDLLIRACKNVKKPFRLNIVGEGPERSKLEKLVKDFSLEKNIHFLGILEGEPLARLLNNHRTMVIPSLRPEGFGIVALEGMACGCDIIAANAGGLSEAVNNFGKLFKMGDQQQLEHLLQAALEKSDKAATANLHPAVSAYLARQNKQTIAAEYIKLFN
jgi:glycosyltransferase involved in cell wall biosynthesis